MARIIEKELNNWDEITNLFHYTFTYFNGFIFRGHANAEWKLESTFTRATKNLSRKQSIEDIYETHLDNFKYNIRGRVKANLNMISEDEILALGQHFGLHTPLLDWTESPYVGLFFACQGVSDKGKRCIWAISNSLISDMEGIDSPKKIKKIRSLTNENPRLVSQQGLFLKLPIDNSLEEVIKKTSSSSDGITAFKIIFDDSLTKDALASLNNMNINNLTLFPDLTGSSLFTNYQLEIEDHLVNKRNEIWESQK
ncbi:MAG: FRG domain-containing protein [Balneola sp.]